MVNVLVSVSGMSGRGVYGTGKVGGFSTPAPATQRGQKYLSRPNPHRSQEETRRIRKCKFNFHKYFNIPSKAHLS